MKLGIGIPLSWHYVPSDFFDSCMLLNKHNGMVIRASSGPIHEMRNTIVRRSLELDCTHLIFLDADMVYPPDTITQLLSHDKDIVGALTFKRWPNFEPLLFAGDEHNMYLIDPIPEGVVKVTATGTGCLMIKTSVFDNMEYPWFEFSSENGKPVGEDINFCYNAKKVGYEIYVDTTIRTEHLCNTRVNWNLYHMQKDMLSQGLKGFTF
jgi:GT2 family glycosyltransferase